MSYDTWLPEIYSILYFFLNFIYHLCKLYSLHLIRLSNFVNVLYEEVETKSTILIYSSWIYVLFFLH